MLSQGYGLTSTLVVSVYAIDTLGAAARETATVTVTPYLDGVFALTEVFEELASEALVASDTDTLMQVSRTLTLFLSRDRVFFRSYGHALCMYVRYGNVLSLSYGKQGSALPKRPIVYPASLDAFPLSLGALSISVRPWHPLVCAAVPFHWRVLPAILTTISSARLGRPIKQVIDVASSTLNAANCTASPDCEARGRLDCGTDGLREDNTCGACVAGSVGVLGPDNSVCVASASLPATCSNGALVRAICLPYRGRVRTHLCGGALSTCMEASAFNVLFQGYFPL